MPKTQQTQLLDLNWPRNIQLHDRGRVFTIECRRVEPADWLKYFAAITVTSEQIEGKRVSTSDFDTPRILLAELVMTGASGYKVDAVDHITQLANWQQRIPLAHRLQIGSTLAHVRVSDPADDFLIRAEGEEVSIDAAWSLDPESGRMVAFQGLKHLFKMPTQAQHKRYSSAASRSVVVGGSRTGKTIYTGAQEVLCELYDELIVSVDGYSWNDTPLADVRKVRDCMDLHHKFTAAQELFNPASTVTTEADAE
jgi:hypothetical protein